MQRIIQVGNLKIKYTLIIKNVKNINMHIEKTGEIIVSCNQYVPVSKVDEFVASKCKWLVDKVNEIHRKQSLLNDQNYYLYLGKRYKIEIIHSYTSGCKILGSNFVIYKKENDEIEKIIQNFEKQQCIQLMSKKMNDVYHMMSFDYNLQLPSLKIRSMDTRWGSCMPRKNQITLNSKLIHYDEKFMDYVILHEYAHLIQPNHSKAFYQVIEKYMPDYKKISENGPKLLGIEDEI